MPSTSHPLQFLLVALARWINQQQRDVIDDLQEENRVLREELGTKRLRLTDDQRLCVSNSRQAATGSCTRSRQWETQRTSFRSAGGGVRLSANVIGVWPSNEA